jgi:hypothetical protein
MNARNDIRIFSIVDVNAVKLAAEAAQRRLAARLDVVVARWLERCATNAVAGQRLFGFKTDPGAQT